LRDQGSSKKDALEYSELARNVEQAIRQIHNRQVRESFVRGHFEVFRDEQRAQRQTGQKMKDDERCQLMGGANVLRVLQKFRSEAPVLWS
jgi:hypothetical protein